jgi:hypothetical protein
MLAALYQRVNYHVRVNGRGWRGGRILVELGHRLAAGSFLRYPIAIASGEEPQKPTEQ